MGHTPASSPTSVCLWTSCASWRCSTRYDSSSRRRSWSVYRGAHDPVSWHLQSDIGQDAYILAGILGHPSVHLENLAEALRAYEHVRLPFANDIVERSRTAGAMYELRSVHGDNYASLGPAIQGQWSWVESEDPAAQIERAIRWMTEQGGDTV